MIITMRYRISQGESVRKEFKEKLPSKSEKYLKTVITFSNSAGGESIIDVWVEIVLPKIKIGVQ